MTVDEIHEVQVALGAVPAAISEALMNVLSAANQVSWNSPLITAPGPFQVALQDMVGHLAALKRAVTK